MKRTLTSFAIFIALAMGVPSKAQNANFLENSKSLAKFYDALKNQSTNNAQTPIHIVMIGDSHTASDLISGSLRFELQSKFGNAGRGIFQAGYPYDGFAPLGLTIKSPKKWTMAKSFPASKSDIGPFALGGYRARVSETNEKYSINAAPGYEFDRISICANTIESRTELGFEILNSRGTINFNEPSGEIDCNIAKLPKTTSQFSLNSIAKQKPVGISSVGIWREGPGIVLSSFGIVGSQAYDLNNRSLRSIAAELAVLPPKLIIIEFGTNEGFDANFDAQKYKINLERQISNLKAIAPDASFLLIGAPDANKKASGATDTQCAIISDEIASKFPNISSESIGADYYSPPNLKLVRKVQREIAEKLDVAFWDWFGFMGGECSANSMATKLEREVLSDRVHFSKLGAQKVGKAIALDIISGFESRPKDLN